jgi:prepilin-type N-terminal cleavage/methylation domain-containing protein/prepilin-type processing-associated H-X9-DG protein
MIYIHKMKNALSSNLAFFNSFLPFAPCPRAISCVANDKVMPKSSPPPVERAFTLIELLVVIATITILVAISLPVFNGVLERGKATKDLSNLRQIGSATQMYMNDNNGVLFSTTSSWMSQLYNADNPAASKYLSSWNIFVSPFDKRTALAPSTTSALSYGINGNLALASISADRISKPTSFIVFAPAQAAGSAVKFQATANTASQPQLAASSNVTVLATNSPGGPAIGGTHSARTKINALFADWHVETMLWSGTGPAFTHMTATGSDPDGELRWKPYTPFP